MDSPRAVCDLSRRAFSQSVAERIITGWPHEISVFFRSGRASIIGILVHRTGMDADRYLLAVSKRTTEFP